MDTNNNNTCGGKCGCGHHSVGPIAIMLIGVAALLVTFNILSSYVFSIVWPILLIVAAAGKLCKCCGCGSK